MNLLERFVADRRTMVRLGDVHEVNRKPRGLVLPDVVPFAAMEDLPLGGEYSARFVDKPKQDLTSGTYFERGDILVAKFTPSFENGKQALTQDLPTPFGYATTEVIPLRPVDRTRDSRFLFFYLLHPDVRSYVAERMEGATGRQRVPDSVLLELPVPQFCPVEETHISDALEHIQRGRFVEERAARLAQALKQTTMGELFTRGLNGGSQTDTAYGRVPEAWTATTLEEVATIQTGAAKGRKFGDDETVDVPYLRVANVQDGHLDLREVKVLRIRQSEVERYRLRNGDVVLTEGGDFDKLGRGFIWRDELPLCIHQNHVFAVRTNPDVLLPEYFAYLAQSSYGRAYFLQVAHKTTSLACIHSQKLKAFPVVFPDLEEQREIVSILDAIDRKLAIHQKKQATLEELFKSLLHALMTGEIRVSDLNLSALAPANAEVPA